MVRRFAPIARANCCCLGGELIEVMLAGAHASEFLRLWLSSPTVFYQRFQISSDFFQPAESAIRPQQPSAPSVARNSSFMAVLAHRNTWSRSSERVLDTISCTIFVKNARNS